MEIVTCNSEAMASLPRGENLTARPSESSEGLAHREASLCRLVC